MLPNANVCIKSLFQRGMEFKIAKQLAWGVKMALNHLVKGVSIAAILAGGSSTIAQAQTPSQTGSSGAVLDEIIVTARRTSESINDAPLSIGVLSSDFLAKQKVESIEEVLQLSPGATFLVFSKAQPEKSLRGFVAPATGNASAEQSIVTVIDGFSLTKDAFKSPPVFDLERVEVCLLYTSPSPRDRTRARMPSSA